MLQTPSAERHDAHVMGCSLGQVTIQNAILDFFLPCMHEPCTLLNDVGASLLVAVLCRWHQPNSQACICPVHRHKMQQQESNMRQTVELIPFILLLRKTGATSDGMRLMMFYVAQRSFFSKGSKRDAKHQLLFLHRTVCKSMHAAC